MDEYTDVLKKCKLFVGVDEKDIGSLLSCMGAKIRKFKKGAYVLRQGETLSNVAVLFDGSLHIQNDDYWGNRSILGQISVGEVFGEAYVLSDKIGLLNDVVAVEDCAVMFVSADKILSPCSSACLFHTVVIRNMFLIIAEKNIQLVRKLGYIGKRSTREKLLSYLSSEAKKQNKSNILIPFNRQQLADFLSVDRSAMSAELCKMRDEGLLTFHKNSFNLL